MSFKIENICRQKIKHDYRDTVSDLGLKKYGVISRQIHKLNKYIRYFVLCLCQKFPYHSGKCGGFLEKMGEKANPPL